MNDLIRKVAAAFVLAILAVPGAVVFFLDVGGDDLGTGWLYFFATIPLWFFLGWVAARVLRWSGDAIDRAEARFDRMLEEESDD